MTKTEHYQLNQWDASDRVLIADFNADNAKIDAALAANGVPRSGRAIELGRQFNGGEQGTATAWILSLIHI